MEAAVHEPKIVIIGPRSLGAGYRLQELGYRNFQLYEASPQIGDLASSSVDSAGFTWDIGGHVMFSLRVLRRRRRQADGRRVPVEYARVLAPHVRHVGALPAPKQHSLPAQGGVLRVPCQDR